MLRRLLLVIVLASVPASLAARSALDDLMIDMRVTPVEAQAPPPLTVSTLEGRTVSLADYRGDAVLVYFWATW